MPGASSYMPPKSKRPPKSKTPVQAVAGDSDSKQAKPRSSSSVGSSGEHDEEEQHVDFEGLPLVYVVEGESTAGDGITRNLLPELDAEADMEDTTDLTSVIEEVILEVASG
jgi:hypothetical protein